MCVCVCVWVGVCVWGGCGCVWVGVCMCKKNRYSSHLDNYRFYSLPRIIPTGLQIKCTPALGNLPPPLQRRWNQILYGTSIRLINVLIKHCASSLDDFAAAITQIEHELQSCCSEAQFERYNGDIDLCLSRQKAITQAQKIQPSIECRTCARI